MAPRPLIVVVQPVHMSAKGPILNKCNKKNIVSEDYKTFSVTTII